MDEEGTILRRGAEASRFADSERKCGAGCSGCYLLDLTSLENQRVLGYKLPCDFFFLN